MGKIIITVQGLITSITKAPPEATAKTLSEILFLITSSAVRESWPNNSAEIAEAVIYKLIELAKNQP